MPPRWAQPISPRWLGSHKTWLGVALAVLAATGVAGLQAHLAWRGDLLRGAAWTAVGPLCGLAAMLGDSLKSFFKRRLQIAPGQPWVPMDQLDFVLAGLLMLSYWVALSGIDVALVLGTSFVGTRLVNRWAYSWGIKSTPA
jgi:CDP-2,3-bis-(O-geranylgeranyl)-sn-glycerol synthase